MSTPLEKALEKPGKLPLDEQDVTASQIQATLDDEESWRQRFAVNRDIVRRMAQEALEEDARGETKALGEHL